MSEGQKNAVANVTAKVEEVETKVDGLVDWALNLVGDHPWEAWLAVANKYVSMFLPLAIAAAGVLACVTGLVVTIKHDAPFSMVMNNLWVLLPTLFALHLAPKALALARSFVEKGGMECVRPELLYILKVVNGLGGVILAAYLLLQFDKDAAVSALAVLVFAAISIIVCTRPGVAGMKAATPANVVEEVFGIFLMPFKIVLALLTVLVGVAAVGGLAYGVSLMFDSGLFAATVLSGTAVMPFVLPMAVYLTMLLALFVVDFCRALAQIPAKLDEVKGAVAGK